MEDNAPTPQQPAAQEAAPATMSLASLAAALPLSTRPLDLDAVLAMKPGELVADVKFTPPWATEAHERFIALRNQHSKLAPDDPTFSDVSAELAKASKAASQKVDYWEAVRLYDIAKHDIAISSRMRGSRM